MPVAFYSSFCASVLLGQVAAFLWQGVPSNGSELVAILDMGSRLTLSGVLLAGVIALWRAYRAQSEERIRHSDTMVGVMKETTIALVENSSALREYASIMKELREEMRECGFKRPQ